MTSISLTHVNWSTTDGRSVIADLDMTFGCERTGLVGRNGIGKSTLLRLIAGTLKPLSGTVVREGTLSLLDQRMALEPGGSVADLFGLEDAVSILRRAERGEASIADLEAADWTLPERFAAAIGSVALDVGLDTPLDALSGGQRTRAGLAAALFAQPDFLLWDEPTNNLDRAGRRLVIEVLSAWKAGAIIVSHDRELLEQMDAIVELTSLGAARYGGGWSRYRQQKGFELAAAQRDLAQAQGRADRIERQAQRASERAARSAAAGARKGARGDLPRILIGARKSAAESSQGEGMRLIERQKRQAGDSLSAARAKVERLQKLAVVLPPSRLSAGRMVLRVGDLVAGYDPHAPIITGMSFSIHGPERVALTGPNGSGKSTLLRAVTGSLPPFRGAISLAAGWAFLDQSVTVLDPAASIAENFRRLNPGSTENDCRAALAGFLFRADAALQAVGMLSGGQLLRAGLACVLGGANPPQLLMLDEPTNHLDIESVEAIETALAAYDGALLVVSHDERFLDAVGIDRRIELARRP
ncbi:MAG TPA: ABC-F family ATP-binding cassette domain-containing protein [Kaistia sp.]|nr:ABC-F family ATP-binding cassette domain-containing protein [Kaistia sp.]